MARDARAELLVDLLHLVGRLRAERRHRRCRARSPRSVTGSGRTTKRPEPPKSPPPNAPPPTCPTERPVIRAERDGEHADPRALRAVAPCSGVRSPRVCAPSESRTIAPGILPSLPFFTSPTADRTTCTATPEAVADRRSALGLEQLDPLLEQRAGRSSAARGCPGRSRTRSARSAPSSAPCRRRATSHAPRRAAESASRRSHASSRTRRRAARRSRGRTSPARSRAAARPRQTRPRARAGTARAG